MKEFDNVNFRGEKIKDLNYESLVFLTVQALEDFKDFTDNVMVYLKDLDNRVVKLENG